VAVAVTVLVDVAAVQVVAVVVAIMAAAAEPVTGRLPCRQAERSLRVVPVALHTVQELAAMPGHQVLAAMAEENTARTKRPPTQR
jgi:hypothetical protein